MTTAHPQSEAWQLHRKIFEAIDGEHSVVDADCDVSGCTCDTGVAIRALLAVIWEHCPSEWYEQIMRRRPPNRHVDDGRCWSCDEEYPCTTVRAIGVELGVIPE